MSQKNNVQVFFHPISASNQKIALVHFIVKKYFLSKLTLDIIAESDKAAAFLDEMLWKYPAFSFIPHDIGNEELSLIHIYSSLPSSSDAKHVLNLRQDPLPLDGHYASIHEIEDSSSKEKKDLSNTKYHFYKENGYKIATISNTK